MYDDVPLASPTIPNKQAILERLDRVLDPELDQSILKLGFIESLEAKNGHLTVKVHLPTYWCAPNFAYMMAEDIRRELLALEDIRDVTVRLKDHVASESVEAGVNSGKSFAEAFSDETSENLDQLRGLFLRKGYIKRQESLLRRLKEAGLSFTEIAALRIEDLSLGTEAGLVGDVPIRPVELGQDYLERRAEIGLDCSPAAPLFIDLRGDPISADRLEKYLIYARTVRVSLEANGALCSALLERRHSKE